MRQVWSIALLLASSILAESLQAQAIPSPFEYIEKKNSAGLFGGYIATDEGKQNAGPQSLSLVGLRYGFQLTGPLSADASVAFARGTRTVYARPVPTETTLETVGEADMSVLVADAGFRFHITGPRTWNRLAPFIVATVGVVADISGTAAAESELNENQLFEFGPGFAASAGFGTDFFLTERLSLRAEARDHLWRYTFPAGLSASGAEEKQWVQNFGFSIGVAFHF